MSPRGGTTRCCPTLPPAIRRESHSMKRYITWVGVLLVAGVLVSCGGGGGGGDGGSPSSAPPPPTPTPTPTPSPTPTPTPTPTPAASTPGRFEESDVARVTLSPGHWTETDPHFGWSGGT